MDSFEVSGKTVFALVEKSPKGLALGNRLLLTPPSGGISYKTRAELVVLSSFKGLHWEDISVRDKESWLTENLADIIARYASISEITRNPEDFIFRFKRLDDTETQSCWDRINTVRQLCREHYGVEVEFESKKINYAYQWEWRDEERFIILTIKLLRINANYIFDVDLFTA